VLAVAGLTGYVSRGRWLPLREPVIAAPAPAAPLQLEVEAQGNGLNVRWNQQSATIAEALVGRLVVRDGDRPTQVIALDRDQLTSGHVYYQSSAERIEFHLEVANAIGAVVKESVLALSSKPAAPLSAQAPAHAGQNQIPARKVQSIPLGGGTTGSQTAKVTEAPVKTPIAPRPFTAPQPIQRGAAPATTILDPPAIGTGGSTAAQRPRLPDMPGTDSSVRIPLSVPPATRASASPQPSPPASSNAGANRQTSPPLFRPPFPTNKVQPVLRPTIAAQIPTGAEIQITVRALINAAGRVVKAEVLRDQASRYGPALRFQLETAAVDAARQWRFEPARSGDKPVPSDHAISFVFRKQ
jgi:hypothetical protein